LEPAGVARSGAWEDGVIITSILDTDLYKFTMQQAVIQQFPDTVVRYELILRHARRFPRGFDGMLRDEIAAMADLAVRPEEAAFLGIACYYLKRPYIDFLNGYRFDPREVDVRPEGEGIRLVVEGSWYRTILWEVPLMALVSELYFTLGGEKALGAGEIAARNRAKAARLEALGARFSDFGTRRRYSRANHELVVAACRQYAPTAFVGTSNPLLAMRHGCKVIGTQAHEWYMAIAALYGYESANRIGMEKWVDVYQGDLGVALTDTFTTGVFFDTFATKYAKLFDGIRQDSGDPLEFARTAIRHYEALKIAPLDKTMVFSDSLDVDAVERIHAFCQGKTRDTYGIGTHLTNDVGVVPLNMVIKLVGVKVKDRWAATVKLSDNSGKHTGPAEAVAQCKKTLRLA
jgi:nicotinate phosphoribosyltransferase